MEIKEVIAVTGKLRSSLYTAIGTGEFPAQVKIGPRSSAWLKSKIDGWLDAYIRAREEDH